MIIPSKLECDLEVESLGSLGTGSSVAAIQYEEDRREGQAWLGGSRRRRALALQAAHWASIGNSSGDEAREACREAAGGNPDDVAVDWGGKA